MSNIQTVRQIYEAFGRGDVAAILEHLHGDVEWEHDMVDHGIPWITPRRGRAQVGKFFETLAAIEFKSFAPLSFLEGPLQVLATVRLEASVKATGKTIRDLEAHLFTFDDHGRVTRFRHFVDTYQHLMAIQP